MLWLFLLMMKETLTLQQNIILPIERVIKGKDGIDDNLPFTEYGNLVNSSEFDGLTTEEAK